MARKPSKQLEQIVMKHNDSGFIPSDTVLQLLSRQNAKFVRMVKKLDPLHLGDREYINRDDLRTALRQGGKK